ncbi:MAG: hypothetical protein NZ773_06885 [Dehalococcoidia bacterium]|nr:hypothetical protein [Dehalococcoidia bacterium]
MTAGAFDLLDTGSCRASEHHPVRGSARRARRCRALVGLNRHPEHGVVLWEAGYAPRILAVTARFPYRRSRLATPLLLDGRLPPLPSWPHGIAASEVRTIRSHRWPPRSSGGADRCPSRSMGGCRGLRRGVLPALLPSRARRQPIACFEGPTLPGLGPPYTLLGDGRVRLVRLPGHRRGQLGALLRTIDGLLLLAADACWYSCSLREERLPHPTTNPFVDDRVLSARRSGRASLPPARSPDRPDTLP